MKNFWGCTYLMSLRNSISSSLASLSFMRLTPLVLASSITRLRAHGWDPTYFNMYFSQCHLISRIQVWRIMGNRASCVENNDGGVIYFIPIFASDIFRSLGINQTWICYLGISIQTLTRVDFRPIGTVSPRSLLVHFMRIGNPIIPHAGFPLR